MANVSFNYIPSNIRSPLVWTEVSNEAAGIYKEESRVLLIGQTTKTGLSEEPILVTSADEVRETYGAGSQIARMVRAFKDNNTFSELWIMPLKDAVSSVKASLTLTVTGAPTKSGGTIHLYIAGSGVHIPVLVGQSVTDIATAIVNKIPTDSDFPVTASNAAGVVTFTAKNGGTVGNSIPVVLNHYSKQQGERTPAGVVLTFNTTELAADGGAKDRSRGILSGGSVDPDLNTSTGKLAESNVGSTSFMYYGHPYADTTTLGFFKTFLNDNTGRWSPGIALDGHAWTAKRGTAASLVSSVSGKNDQHQTLIGYEKTLPADVAQVVGAYVGRASQSLSIDPARPLQTLELIGLLTAPNDNVRFTLSEHETLLNSGVATISYKSGHPAIERSVTTYLTDGYGVEDASYMDVETLATLSYIRKSWRALCTQKFPRMKLAADGTKFGQGNSIVTPSDIKAAAVAWYDDLIAKGFCQNMERFKALSIVSLNSSDPSRVDVLLAPTLVNGLRIIATKIEFRLNA